MKPMTDAIAEVLDVVPPHRPESEIALLGTMLCGPEGVDTAATILHGSDDFFDPRHAVIFDAIIHLHDSSSPIEMVILVDHLKTRGQFNQVGGYDYLTALFESMPSASNAAYYADIVRKMAKLRAVDEFCGQTMFDIRHKAGDPEELVDELEARVFEICKRENTRPSFTIGEKARQLRDRLESGDPPCGLRTGFIDLDHRIRSMKAANMVVIAGRPSMGKTSLATNIAEHLAIDRKVPVAFFTLEMSADELTARIIASRAGINAQRITEGDLSSSAHGQVVEAVEQVSEAPLHIIDKGGLSIAELKARARRLVSQHDVQLVVIDYLQLLTAPGQSRYETVTNASNAIKALAGQLEVPIIVVSQLNRSVDSREGHRPRMSDLKESGAIEQDADLVLLLHREEYYHADDPNWQEENHDKLNIAELKIDKNRNGATGMVELVFNRELTKFRSLQR